MTRSLIFIPLLAVFLSCAVKERVEIYQVGDVEVRLYSSREAMAKELPEVLQLADNLRVTDKVIKVFGYYDRENNVIYSVNDARTVVHEFRHHLEPDWKHGFEEKKNRGSKIED